MKLSFRTLPPSINHLYGRYNGRVYLKPEARVAKEAIGWEARSQYRGDPLAGPLSVSVKLYWPDRRNRDADNGMKLLLDALTGIVWTDDKQIKTLAIDKNFADPDPRVEMTIEAALL